MLQQIDITIGTTRWCFGAAQRGRELVDMMEARACDGIRKMSEN